MPPDTSPEPISGPLLPLPWWLPGLALGLIAALVAGLVSAAAAPTDPGPSGAYCATARVWLRPTDGAPAVTASDRQRVSLLVRDHDLLARVLAAPEAPGFGPADPAAFEQRLTVEAADGDALTVSLFGDAPDDLGPLLDQTVLRIVEELAARDRRDRDERVAQLEKTAAALRTELESQERALELVARANGGGDAALLRERLVRAETDLAKSAPELALLELHAGALKKRQPPGGTADPVEAARLVDADPRVAPLLAQRAEAAVAVEKERAIAPGAAPLKDLQAKLDRAEAALTAARVPVRKEVDALLREADARRAAAQLEGLEGRLAVARATQESLRRERDELHKALAAAHATAASAESVRRTLAPVQEQFDRVGGQLVQLRASSAAGRAHVAGPAAVQRVRRAGYWGDAFGAAVRAFAAAFALATAFQITGLVFRALQPR